MLFRSGAEKLSSLSKLRRPGVRGKNPTRQFLFGSPALEFHVLLPLLYSAVYPPSHQTLPGAGLSTMKNCRQPPGGALRWFCTHISPNTLGITNSSALTANTKRLSLQDAREPSKMREFRIIRPYFGFPT